MACEKNKIKNYFFSSVIVKAYNKDLQQESFINGLKKVMLIQLTQKMDMAGKNYLVSEICGILWRILN